LINREPASLVKHPRKPVSQQTYGYWGLNFCHSWVIWHDNAEGYHSQIRRGGSYSPIASKSKTWNIWGC
jgi:hypothetical protein